MGDKLGYTILLLGISNIKKKIIQLRVHPCLVAKNSLLAKVKNEFNLNFDKTYKVTNYLFKSNGKI